MSDNNQQPEDHYTDDLNALKAAVRTLSKNPDKDPQIQYITGLIEANFHRMELLRSELDQHRYYAHDDE